MAIDASLVIERCTQDDLSDWLALRLQLWSWAEDEHLPEMRELLARRSIALIARASGTPVGFAEATLRSDYVNGCVTSPVAFLEGIYVVPAWRKRGIARRLCAAVEEWAAAMGCAEFASDAEIDNTVSHQMHARLGFEETERVVYFKKALR